MPERSADDAAFIGLISGTSMDGIDAVVVRFGTVRLQVLAAATLPFDDPLKDTLRALQRAPERLPLAAVATLDARLGEAFAAAALEIIALAGLTPDLIAAIGSHGQTLLHQPGQDWATSVQAGDPTRIAERTGIITVSDFRRADMAAGGQGAPLAPLLHRAMLASPDEQRLVVNLGGIANLTVLEPDGSVRGFDTGPANCLLDEWYRRHHSDTGFDRDGRWATGGRVDHAWLALLRRDAYLDRDPPKSTGIEYFSPAWLDRHLPAWAGSRPADIQATLAELTASSLADAVHRHASRGPARVLACGGGVHNRHLMDRLTRLVEPLGLETTAGYGLDPDYVEAILFAWLACQRLSQQRLDTGPITGARHSILAGALNQP
ncbi:MAG: anhydro-N-acetylmuramic acid kinase [Pseudomonadota bacterium]|nr:MAG: anhydro-N-acetylmuramic acid kinase [Pseudomonadota bacterium]